MTGSKLRGADATGPDAAGADVAGAEVVDQEREGADVMGSGLLEDNPSRQGLGATTWRFARSHRWNLVLALTLGLLSTLSITLGPVVVGKMTDALLARDRNAVLTWGLGGLVLAIASPVLGLTSRARLAAAGEYLIRDVRDAVARQLATVSLRFVERHRAGELVQRSTAEVAALSLFVRDSLTELLMTLATVVLFAVVLASQSWVMLLVLFGAFVPPSLFVLHRFRSRAASAYAAEAQAEAEVAADLAESIRLRTVIGSAPPLTQRRLRERFVELNGAAVAAQMRTVVLGRWIGAMSLIEGVALAVLLFVGATLVEHGVVTLGVVVTFVLASVTLFSSFSDLVALVGSVEEVLTGAARVNQLLEHTAEQAVSADCGVAADESGQVPAVELTGVTFSYGDAPALTDVSLTIEQGARVGLAGPSGAGKSTLATLMCGLYRPDCGTVRCCGEDVGALDARQRAELVAMVPQEVHLGAGTLAQELRLVVPDADDATLRAAFDRLGLGRWMASLPDGLETAVGGDSTLSAGERQVIGLARVALRGSRVIVLDEATSDLDPAVAALVETAMDELAADRTVVVVAHRPETIARMERVIRVEGGRVVAASGA